VSETPCRFDNPAVLDALKSLPINAPPGKFSDSATKLVYRGAVLASLAQAVALVAHGNAFFTVGGEAPELVDTNTAFQYVGELRFTSAGSRMQETSWLSRVFGTNSAEPPQVQGSASTADWFKHLRDSGVRRLWLASYERTDTKLPSHVAVAFAGFSQWGILAEQEETASWWRGHEELINPPSKSPHAFTKAKGNRIWRVIYQGSVAGKPGPILPSFAEAREQFLNAVCGAIEFADIARLEFWRKWLEEARAQFDSTTPQPRFHRDMLPGYGYNLQSRQLLAAASSAWVFGGMGSWNDMSFDGALKQKYDHVTPTLYTAVVQGIVAATNAFDRSLAQDVGGAGQPSV
jgi:hypothetical protein